MDDKVNKALGGQSTSLPASRHNSVSDLTILNDDENEKLQEIKEKLSEQSPNKQSANKNTIGTRSTPHSPKGSPRQSLKDITEQVAIIQNSLESSIILSNSTVSLISMNDGQNLKLPEENDIYDENTHPKMIGKKSNIKNELRRRVSLQELSMNVDKSLDGTNKSKIT